MPRFRSLAHIAAWLRCCCASSVARSSDRDPSPARARCNARIAFGIAMVLVLTGVSSCAQSTVTTHISHASVTTPYDAIVTEASRRYGIPAAWIRAIMHAESFGDVRVTSPKGAMGLMQIMPDTWAALRRRYHLGDDPYDPHDNIMAGAAYLRELRDRYGSPGFLAAYNAGPARWEDHLATGRPLPAETRAYLARLMPLIAGGTTVHASSSTSIAHVSTAGSLLAGEVSNRSGDTSTVARQRHHEQSNTRSVEDWTGLAPTFDGLFIAMPSDRSPQ